MNDPFVMLPGMMCDARMFQHQIAAFSAQRSICVASLTERDTVDGLAKDVLASAPERFALLGLSMGGIVAMEVIRQAPERITRLALLDTNPRAELTEVAANRNPQMQSVREGNLRAVMRDEMKPNYLTDGPQKPKILELCMEMAEALGPDEFINQSLALQSRPDQQETLRNIKVPTLILCGEEDIPCPVERHQLMHTLIPHSTLEIIPNAGHLPVLEQPEATNNALEKWLGE